MRTKASIFTLLVHQWLEVGWLTVGLEGGLPISTASYVLDLFSKHSSSYPPSHLHHPRTCTWTTLTPTVFTQHHHLHIHTTNLHTYLLSHPHYLSSHPHHPASHAPTHTNPLLPSICENNILKSKISDKIHV